MIIIDKLAQIKAKAKPHTLRKAAITAEQLRRRYNVLADPSNASVHLLAAARWYSKQEPVVQAALDNTDPLTWLKHLLDKHGSSSRLPWHLTALIIEEYARSLGRSLHSIPEDGVPSGTTPVMDLSPTFNAGASPEAKPNSKSPSSDSWSWTPPPQSLEPSLSRKRGTSPDTGISFEPQIDSGRSSAGADSRRSSLDPIANQKRLPLAYGSDSARSSLHHGTFTAGYSVSPTNSRMHFRELASRIRRKAQNRSDDALSSARNSISEHSPEEESSPSKKDKGKGRPMSLQLVSTNTAVGGREPRTPGPPLSPLEHGMSDSGDAPTTARQISPFPPPDSAILSRRQSRAPSRDPSRNPSRSLSRNPSPTPRIKSLNPPQQRQRRMSLPSMNEVLVKEQEKRRLLADEEQERREYEHKTQ